MRTIIDEYDHEQPPLVCLIGLHLHAAPFFFKLFTTLSRAFVTVSGTTTCEICLADQHQKTLYFGIPHSIC